jgi:uncharacterized delta-60 repeat protein
MSANDDSARGLAVMPDGRFVAAGTVSTTGSDSQFGVARYNSAGILDGSFNGTGKAVTPIGTFAIGQAVAVQPDGKVIVAGEAQTGGSTFSVALMRYTADGALDSTFGNAGKVLTSFTGNDRINAVALQIDGRIVVAGSGNDDGDFLVARYNNDGTLDTGFAAGGRVITAFSPNKDYADAVAIQPDGKIVAAGAANPSASPQTDDLAVARYLGANDPAPVALAPFSHISSPGASKLSHKKLKKFSGTAGPAGTIAKVEIALRRIDPTQLRRHKKCLWLKSPKPKFQKITAAKIRCPTQKWLRADGTVDWSYKLKKTLPPGNYELFVRTTLSDGQQQTLFTTTAGNYRKLKLT